MRVFIKPALIACALALPVGGALAADVMSVPVSTPSAIEMPIYDSPGFDWSGFYAGVFAGVTDAEVSGTQYGLGVNLGVNATFDFYLVGAEVSVQGLNGEIGESVYGQILGRAGLIVTEDVVVYGAGGYGIDLGTPDEQDYLLGAGVELALTDSVSVRAQYLRGFPVTGDDASNQFTFGAQLHF